MVENVVSENFHVFPMFLWHIEGVWGFSPCSARSLCCVTSERKCNDITHIDYVTVSLLQESGHILAGLFARWHSRCWTELGSLLEAGLDKSSLPCSFRMLAEFTSLWQSGSIFFFQIQ